MPLHACWHLEANPESEGIHLSLADVKAPWSHLSAISEKFFLHLSSAGYPPTATAAGHCSNTSSLLVSRRKAEFAPTIGATSIKEISSERLVYIMQIFEVFFYLK